jgi:Bacterial transcriptional activator domain
VTASAHAGARADTGDAQLVATVGGRSYRLNARSGHLDLVIFGRLVREAREAAVEVTRRRAEVVLRYAEAATGAGAPSRALSHLRELCTGEPLNEQSHARFMIALVGADAPG